MQGTIFIPIWQLNLSKISSIFRGRITAQIQVCWTPKEAQENTLPGSLGKSYEIDLQGQVGVGCKQEWGEEGPHGGDIPG